MELIVLAVVAGLSFASYALWRQARGSTDGRDLLPGGRPQAALPSGERSIHTLQVGDVVIHLGTDYLVEGVLSLDDDGRVTRLYRMMDGSRVRWLGARPADDHPLLLDEAPEVTVEANGPEALEHRQLPYRLAARAHTGAAGVGAVGAGRDGGRVELYEYAGAGGARVVALVWPSRVEVFAGERLDPTAIELLPGR